LLAIIDAQEHWRRVFMQEQDQRGEYVPLGVVYTDTGGRVVFVNRHFLQLLKVGEGGSSIGQSLWEVLGVEKQAALHLLEAQQGGDKRELIVEYVRPDGSAAYILCTGEVAFDDAGNFIGVNIALEYLRETRTEDPQYVSKVAGSGVTAQISEVEAKVDETAPPLLEEYFVAIITSLQVLLARLAGPGIRESLETLIDELATAEGWPISVRDSQIVISPGEPGVEVYRALLTEAIDYAVAVVGRRLIANEMETIYRQLAPNVLETARKSGLRWAIDNHF
jgi:hypothetical protein